MTTSERWWVVRVEHAQQAPITPDQHIDALGELADMHASGTLDRDGLRGSIRVTLAAATPMEAVSSATKAVHDALTEAAVHDAEIVGIEVRTEDRFLADLDKPLYPPMVSQTEIGEMLGVSRQRVGRIVAHDETFPTASIETGQGKLWAQHAVAAWLKEYNSRPQRVRRYAGAQ